MKFSVGSLVKTRGREWVVLPESTDDMLILRPLGGSNEETAGIYLPLEKVEEAHFDLPDPNKPGDYRSCRLLRDAVRLGFRSSAGPFRSFAKIAVEPRSYQLVPLLVGLKLDPVRVLIADDVGIGKTIEACLIARELIDRGEVNQLAVLCPPHLAEQWQKELKEKFHIDAELVLSSTARKLERNCRVGQSLFEIYPYVVVSLDFIKTDERRNEFFRTCPELVIVDEAHTCAYAYVNRGGRHQRYQLISGLASDLKRHIILVTATPHSGKEEAFRVLISFLKPDFRELPEDISGEENKHHRRHLARHFIQRRRGDIEHFMQEKTDFPERDESEETYTLTLGSDYIKFMNKILRYARETVTDETSTQFKRRIRWWSALALLRSIASSPAAAAETLRNRASMIEVENADAADEIGKKEILDLMDESTGESVDTVPGSDIGEHAEDEQGNRRRLLELAREADKLKGKKDEKLQKAINLVKGIIKEGYNPIVFCRFIPTAEYVAAALREKLKGIEVTAVTGNLPPAERELRVKQLAGSDKYVLVATDCLSEGINLQEYFDAVMHYDLSWNPTRHEQREGRVDRFGQPQPKVKVLTYYGINNQIDGIVLEVLIKKHRSIRKDLGVSVPIPADSEQVIEAIFEGLLLREKAGIGEQQLTLFEDLISSHKNKLHQEWDKVKEREKRSRTMFAQETIKFEEVAQEVRAIRAAIGTNIDVANFIKDIFRTHRAVVSDNGASTINVTESPRSFKDILEVHIRERSKFKVCFEKPNRKDEIYLVRTHPIVESLAGYVMDTALEEHAESAASRCGVFRTGKVSVRTTMLLLRHRFHIITKQDDHEWPLLSEDCQIVGFTGSPENPQWLDKEVVNTLFHSAPEANISRDQAAHFLNLLLENLNPILSHLDNFAIKRGNEVLEAHERVRAAAKLKGMSFSIKPQLPSDVLGVYIYLPVR